MVQLHIRGVDVDFPFPPYDCQVSYMEKVIQCLQQGKNGILESPTGTGKTLCLLCATLAWRESYVAERQLKQRFTSDQGGSNYVQALGKELQYAAHGDSWGANDDDKGSYFEAPRILYSSRTHSQLSQAVQELKNTIYRPKVSIIGSREQLCVNNDVLKQETNSAKVHMCRAKVQARTCHFFNNLDANKANKDFTQSILDIEDLVELGQRHRVCPYYMARELKTTADIIFMPYNYLLDLKSRKANNVDISSSIILFDEAHNLEKTCEETASFDLTSFDIASCIEDVAQCIEIIECREQNVLDATETAADVDISKEDLAHLKSLFIELEKLIDIQELPKNGDGLTKPGSFMFELLGKLNMNFSTKDQVLEVLDKCNTLLVGDTQKFRGKHFALQKFSDALQIIFSKDALNQSSSINEAKFFKVHIQLEPDSNKKKKNLDVWTTGSKFSKQGRTLSYWCFSPGHAMIDLMSYGVRTVVLTSGTLSPLESFRAEMQISFPIQLENPHVIERHQMMVGVVTKAPDGATLNSSYETRFTTEYMTGLGNAIVNFSRTVPNGLLVFFPSYPVMNKCLEHWQNSGTWSRLEQHKPLFAEPKGKGDFAETMERFYEKINDPSCNAATFFAVCRGKVSEGLDFADMNGRAEVITGLPFPPKMDAKVRLKMNFLDESLQKAKSFSSKGLSGRQWYRQQASRAVNQAVGRVIRHKQDFGAILLCDVRFTYPDAVQQLPSWMKPYVKVYKDFGSVQRDLIHFFRTADKMVDKSSMKVKSFKNNSSRAENPSAKTISGENLSHMSIEETELQKNKRKETGNEVKTQAAREAPVSSLRLKYVYKSSGVKDMANTAKPASLIESLTNSEAASNTELPKESQELKERSLSEAIMKRKESNRRTQPRKVLKVVKVKEEEKPRSSLDLDSLIEGLTPLFTANETHYPLMHGFSSFIRDPVDKVRFFEAYCDITGSDVPSHFTAGLNVKKEDDSRPVNDHCRVGEKRKPEENNQALANEQNRKITKVQSSSDKVFKPEYASSVSGTSSSLLDFTKHLNGGGLL
ncbi:Regulator of telomere elongation helicase 1 [Stylophora pistillata]|uniref:Regulator of telomere elongation helicase 1 homolog n=1 Tax=Stylophora pistillata TaxID=50429 RepID=A0A2B4SJ60_STYPI|nr:Regulator of telomere elongation helicase 1 [Stylophora pistillata]